MAHYERLSALDASFLGLEDAASHMHVAAALLFEGEPLRGAHGGVDAERVRRYVESRLDAIPRYRQRLAWIPLERHPVWVDDPRFNIFYHVRHAALPQPGSERQLKRFCGRVLSQKLDPTKPLWEMVVVEGLEGGRVALVMKAHHAMVDGIAGIDLLTTLLSSTPEATFVPAGPWTPRPAPSPGELVLSEAWRRAAGLASAWRMVGEAVRAPVEALGVVRERALAMLESALAGLTPASPTPINPAIGPHRRFDWLRLGLDDVKAVRARLGGTLNDVVLATVVGAARRFLDRRGIALAPLDFRALVPVSVRPASTRGTFGNRVANLIARLPVAERDPERRYRRVVAETTQLKRSQQALGVETLEELSNWTSTAMLTELMRWGVRQRPYNLVVSNVPGPQIPLYLLGARLLESYPMVPLFVNQAVGIALFSYAGGLHWGVNADWDAVPDLHDLVGDLAAEFDTLAGLRVH